MDNNLKIRQLEDERDRHARDVEAIECTLKVLYARRDGTQIDYLDGLASVLDKVSPMPEGIPKFLTLNTTLKG